MLPIDTSFSGKIDKDEPTVVAQADTDGDGTVKMRAFKAQRDVNVVAIAPAAPRRKPRRISRASSKTVRGPAPRTGAVVISSPSGNEYALEGAQWHKAVFTYALLNGLKNRAADSNKDGIVTVSKLQGYVIEQVRKLTEGG